MTCLNAEFRRFCTAEVSKYMNYYKKNSDKNPLTPFVKQLWVNGLDNAYLRLQICS